MALGELPRLKGLDVIGKIVGQQSNEWIVIVTHQMLTPALHDAIDVIRQQGVQKGMAPIRIEQDRCNLPRHTEIQSDTEALLDSALVQTRLREARMQVDQTTTKET